MRALLRYGVIVIATVSAVAVSGLSISSAEEANPKGSSAEETNPKGKELASPEQKENQKKAQESEAGKAGTVEPSAEVKTTRPEDVAAFVNGRLAAAGAPADSQTVPAKFSKRNASLDGKATMAFPTPLTEDQKKRILEAVKSANAPVVQLDLHPSDQLPSAVEMRALPQPITAAIPAIRDHYYVRTKTGVLLVIPASRIIVVELAG